MNLKIFDIGGTFLKVYCSKTKITTRIAMQTEAVISVENIKTLIRSQLEDDTEYIGISSQMHGFVLFDEFNNNLSDFVTWKVKSETSIFVENNIFNTFDNTGLEKRDDLPINNIYDYIKQKNISNTNIKVKNITEAILDTISTKTHVTMACGNGFYDIYKKEYIKSYVDLFYDLFKVNLLFDDVIFNREVVGTIINTPVYVGIGDFQASLYSCNFSNNPLFINMATGSQIAIISDTLTTPGLSCRPFFNNKIIECITHIPCGRFLNIFDTFLKTVGISLWDEINRLRIEDVYASNIIITTDIFSGQGICISKIYDNTFKLTNFISSIFKSFLWQYINIIKNNKFKFDNIILSGGIAKRIPLIRNILYREFNVTVNINNNDDDSIGGVLKFINEH